MNKSEKIKQVLDRLSKRTIYIGIGDFEKAIFNAYAYSREVYPPSTLTEIFTIFPIAIMHLLALTKIIEQYSQSKSVAAPKA
jgi:hypothetical protein